MRVSHLFAEMRCFKMIFVFSLFLLPEPTSAWRINTVKSWARDLGNELWKLNEVLTNTSAIRHKYKQMNAGVKQKNGIEILESAVESVSTMLTGKINAVKCIHATAEEMAREFNYSLIKDKMYKEDYQYCSAKYSVFHYEDGSNSSIEDLPKFATNNSHYQYVDLEKDSHFYDIPITTSTSCVQVPTNIYDGETEALNAILWSKRLNDIFIKNYNTDPSLAWQYFGSSKGVFRFYPGMPWQKGTDTYDCRVKSWYIEAATCSKDVIILFDVSGSMTGFKNYVARTTLSAILDTLSNNDYINVYAFKKDKVMEVVDCFVDLVQATPENIKTLNDALTPDEHNKHKIPLEGNATLSLAYIKAFETLRQRREGKCAVDSQTGCNQMVMLITDYVPGNLTEVFEEHNRETINGTVYIPVRVFTYLIGKEVTNVREIMWMGCLNRGYYVHIRSVEEVQQQVLKYINVIARPMILNGTQPPPTWTHAATDHTRTKAWDVSKDVNMPNEDKLVTSVAIPAFDYRYNEEHKNDTMLLGVAGTDVPIDSIAKLAQPHQLGVNGYSFIVSNNGYLLLHPLLITSINEKLQKNYNSVDFVEVEQIDDGNGARILGEEILRLREKLVNGVPGYELDLPVLYHYDNMRRLARVRHDYYFKNLEGTPFSIGISLPKVYGDTELLLKDNPEALKGQNLTGINVTDYFRYSYRVHPDWVYCKFHYLEGHETNHPEMEIWNFLVNISHTKADISRVQYNSSMHSLPFNASTHCGSATSALGKDDYYCNEDLVKQLVFDAKLSEPYFKEWNPREAERVLADKYNVSVRFIATSSGLTRWHYIHDDSKNERVDDEGERHREYIGKVFGDLYPNTIEETWYKAAVLQHTISKYSLVISTPLPILDDIIDKRPPVVNDDGDITMTASYAIFYKDGVGPSSETPASVVGFQFSYLSLFEVFSELTNTGQDIRCNGTDFACYIIDSSGYVVLSGQISDVGTFFGVLEPGVMQSFLDKDIFTNVTVFNYQALCSTKSLKKKSNSSWSLATPFSAFKSLIQWILWEAIILLSSAIDGSYAQPLDGYVEASTTEAPPEEDQKAAFKEKKVDTFSCDHEINLYIMNQSHFLQDEMALSPVVYEDQPTDCNPAYWAAYMMKVNWMVIAVQKENWGKKGNCTIPPTTKPIPTNNSIDSLEPCHKLDLANLNRRRLEGCYTYHEKERNITECGRGSRLGVGLGTPLATMVLALATSFLS